MRRQNLDNLKISLAPPQNTKYNSRDILEYYIMYLVQSQDLCTVWFTLLKLPNSENSLSTGFHNLIIFCTISYKGLKEAILTFKCD